MSEGLLVVDKPAGMTSHDVVGKIRRLAGTRRVGHAGTLDPMATGVLVLGIDRATRLLGHLALHDKAYDATVRLGRSTTTDDAEGEFVGADAASEATTIGDAQIVEAMSRLTGEIEQVPSTVSAIKVDGVRAYRRARDGESVDLKPRSVTVSSLTLEARRGADLDIRVECTTGTYVRALARDLGNALGVGGHLTALRRTRSGPYRIEEARTLGELEQAFTVVPLADAVDAAFPRIDVTDEEAQRISFGQRLVLELPASPAGVFAPDGRVIALVEERNGVAQPLCVFS